MTRTERSDADRVRRASALERMGACLAGGLRGLWTRYTALVRRACPDAEA